jgi:hypothetical protein
LIYNTISNESFFVISFPKKEHFFKVSIQAKHQDREIEVNNVISGVFDFISSSIDRCAINAFDKVDVNFKESVEIAI